MGTHPPEQLDRASVMYGPASVVLSRAVAAGLGAAGVVHGYVAAAHIASALGFALASLICAVAQLAIGLRFEKLRSRRAVLTAVLVLTLVPLTLWIVNVVHGLPAAFAHSHVPGEFLLGGVTFRRPGPVETSGLIAVIVQSSAAIAVVLGCRQRPNATGWRRAAHLRVA